MHNNYDNLIRYEWNSSKSIHNAKKHGVTFDEAKTAFLDEHARLVCDPEHSEEEDRFILLGLSTRLRLLVVSHCYRENDDVIRIISARKADPFEQRQYAEFLI
jgi:uncharacterized DUF497 family protein